MDCYDLLPCLVAGANTWFLMAGCRPYFYTYLLPLLARYGMWDEALSELRSWKVMLDHDGTTLWETFACDHLDSFCHPWSGAPVDLWKW